MASGAGKGYMKAKAQQQADGDIQVGYSIEEEVSESQPNLPLLTPEVERSNQTTACIIVNRYSQLFLETDLLSSFETRLLNPNVTQQIKTHWKQACEVNPNTQNVVNLNVKFYKNGERRREIEKLITHRYREDSRLRLRDQNSLVIWDLVYASLFFVVSVLLMFAAGYLADFWVENNEDEIPNAVTVLTTLVCTYAIQVKNSSVILFYFPYFNRFV